MCELGHGAYGKVCKHRSRTGQHNNIISKYMTKRRTVVLEDSERCRLGSGVYGIVCSHREAGNSGDLYAVKVPINGAKVRDSIRERELHTEFYNSIPDKVKKYFPEPVSVRWARGGTADDVYAMTEVRGAKTLESVFESSSMAAKKRLLRKLRTIVMEIWKAGYIHADLHLKNVAVDKNGQLVVLDFGFMGKVTNKPPDKHDGDHEQQLDDKWVAWFKKEWPKHLKRMGLKLGNPNMVVWPRQMQMKYHASRHASTIVSIANDIALPRQKLKFSVAELKAKLKAKGLATTGLKNVLRARLNAAKTPSPPKAKTPTNAKTPMPSPDPKGWEGHVNIWNRILAGNRNALRYTINKQRAKLTTKDLYNKHGDRDSRRRRITAPIKELKVIAKNKGIKIPAAIKTKDEIANFLGRQAFPSPNYAPADSYYYEE